MKVIVTKSKLENLADKVRAKAGTQAEMTIDEMATAVENIPSGGNAGRCIFKAPTITVRLGGES